MAALDRTMGLVSVAAPRPLIVTHAGLFHADDLFGVTVLLDVFRGHRPRLARVRRDQLDGKMERWRRAGCEVLARVDIGDRDDAADGAYDHHQRGFSAARPNGLLYASFGLVWRVHGEAWVAQTFGAGVDAAAVAAIVDRILVQSVDAGDTGATFFEVTPAGCCEPVLPATVSVLASWLVPAERTAATYDAAFRRSIPWARQLLRGAAVAACEEALAAEAVALADDGGPILMLGRSTNWLRHARPHHQFVIFPGDGETPWYLQTVPDQRRPGHPRAPLPGSWGGLRGTALAEVTGVSGGLFCHAGCWIAGASSREAAEQLAAIALSGRSGRLTRHR